MATTAPGAGSRAEDTSGWLCISGPCESNDLACLRDHHPTLARHIVDDIRTFTGVQGLNASLLSSRSNRLTGANSASEQQQLSHVKRNAPVLAHRASDFFSVVVGVSSDLPALGIKGWALRGVLPGRMDLSAPQDAASTSNTGSVSPEQHGSRLRRFFEPDCGPKVRDGQHEPVRGDLIKMMIRVDLRIVQSGVLRRYACCIQGRGHIAHLLLIDWDPITKIWCGQHLKFVPPGIRLQVGKQDQRWMCLRIRA